MRLQDKVAVVTGAASGIGRETAILFAQEGASVVVADLNADGESTVDNIRKMGGGACFTKGDVSIESDAERIVDVAINEYGTIDILFNNAGINMLGAVHDLSRTDWDRLLSVNLTGTFLVSKHAVKHMMKQKRGSIVNNASTFGLIGREIEAVYCASKGAVIALTRQMAIDYSAYNIRVNCVCPGITLTPRIRKLIENRSDPEEYRNNRIALVPLRRYADPREIAYPVLFLASDESSFVTGASLVADGGETIL
ncbi:MAG: SDR family NAD(P)-dependent oxidoreductase [Nitrososphaerales archaeon]